MRTRTTLAALFVLIMAAVSAAQTPLSILPEAGKLCGFVSSQSPGKWLVFGPDGFKPVQPQLLNDGKAVVWQGDPGEYAVIQIPPGDEQPLVAVVQLGEAAPPTPPTPPAPPTPPVTVPEGKYGLGPKAYQWAAAVAVPHRASASALADNFESVAAGIAAGSWKTPQQSNQELTGRNRAVLGQDGDPLLEAWRPWFVAWQQDVDALLAAGKLPATVDEYRVLYLETALGLKAVK